MDGIRDSATSNSPASPFAPFLWAAPNGAEPVPYLQKMISDCYFIRQSNALVRTQSLGVLCAST